MWDSLTSNNQQSSSNSSSFQVNSPCSIRSTIDLDLLDSNDNDKISTLSLISFHIKSSPDFFNVSNTIKYFSKIESLIMKKSPLRIDAFVSFGGFIFNLKKQYNQEEFQYINRIYKLITENLNCEQAYYAYLAVLSLDPQRFRAEAPHVFKQKMSPFIIQGLNSVIEKEPSLKNFIYTSFLEMSDKELLKETSNPDSVTMIFEHLIKFQISSDVLTLSNALQYSKHLYSSESKVRRAAVTFLLKYQETCNAEEIALVLLTFAGLDEEDSVRINVMKILSKTTLSSPDIISCFQTLLTDNNRKIRKYTYIYLVRFLHQSNVESSINQFILQQIRDLKQTKKIQKDHIDAFLILGRFAFSKESSLGSQKALSILNCHAGFLMKQILKEPGKLFADALEVLSYLITILPDEVDENLLVKHLIDSFSIISSKHILDSALKLFETAIQYTNLKFSIYTKHSILTKHMIKLTKLRTNEISYEQLYNALAMIGAIQPLLISLQKEKISDSNLIKSTNFFLAQCTSESKVDKLIYSSVGVAISHILYILSQNSLSSLESDAVNALVGILNSSRQISQSLSDDLALRLDMLLKTSSESIVSQILSSIKIFLIVLNEKFEPVIPTVVNIIREKWNSMDQILLTRAITHLLLFYPQSLANFLPKIAKCIVTNLEIQPVSITLSILSVFESMEKAVSTVDYIVYPAILSWISLNCDQTKGCQDALAQITSIFAFGGTAKYATPIIRTLLQAVTINPNLNNAASDLLAIVSVHVGKSFLLYLPQISSVITINDNTYLKNSINSYENDFPLNDSILKFCNPVGIGKAIIKPITLLSGSLEKFSLTLPTANFDKDSWNAWYEGFFSLMIKHSPSRSIQICSAISEKFKTLKDALAQISIALMYIKPPFPEISDNILSIINIIFSSEEVPRNIISMFLGFIGICESLYISIPISEDLICEKAIKAGLLPLGLRFSEKLFNDFIKGQSKEIAENLLLINNQLGLPLANKGVLKCIKEKNIQLDYTIAEKLRLWEKALKFYNENLKTNPENDCYQQGALNCLQNMLKFDKLLELSGSNQLQRVTALWFLFQNNRFSVEARKLPLGNTSPIGSKNLNRSFSFNIHANNSQINITNQSINRSSVNPNNYKLYNSTSPIQPSFYSMTNIPLQSPCNLSHDNLNYNKNLPPLPRNFSNDETNNFTPENPSNFHTQPLPGNHTITMQHLIRNSNLNKSMKLVRIKLDNNDKKNLIITSENIKMFFHVVTHLMDDEIELAQEKISRLKKDISGRIIPHLSEDYEHSYTQFSSASIIYDLESVLQYKTIQKQMETSDDYDKKKLQIMLDQNTAQWRVRFDNLPDNAKELYEHIRVRSLVMSNDAMKPLIERLIDTLISEKKLDTIKSLLQIYDGFSQSEKLKISMKIDCVEKKYDQQISILMNQSNPGLKVQFDDVESRIATGKWLLSQNRISDAVKIIENAIFSIDKISSKVDQSNLWNVWAKANTLLSTNNPKYLEIALSASINGLLISSENDQLKFTLQIISIVFRHGNPNIYKIFNDKLKDIPSDVWIYALPQIIACFGFSDATLIQLVKNLLYQTSLNHPQTILYSLLVPYRSKSIERKSIAENIVERIKNNYPTIVNRTLHFTKELIRIGSSWWELWYSQIDEASRALVLRNNDQEMLNLLTPLFELISNTPETLFEISFARQFSAQLSEAEKHLKVYQQTKNKIYLSAMWTILTSVFRQTKMIVESLGKVPIVDASPSLSEINNQDIIVPGLQLNKGERVTIKEIEKEITIFKSIQRPRKISMTGSDGKMYSFLLKPNEDTRLDERVMQLFKYVNNIIKSSKIPLKTKLTITSYMVIPLTNKMGLIGWVPGCQTIGSKISEYRKKCNIAYDAEKKKAFATAGGSQQQYENLPLQTKILAFKAGLSATSGDDIEKILIINSFNPYHWLHRRTLYSTSLAVTSMIGYILGLGDRHLSNIMMKDVSAKLVHIDFGDCFEVTMKRADFPERVPFRLTRLFRNGLEVSKIEGTFRNSCENIMKIIRQNSDQILGILDVFKYDPLLKWIIVDEKQGAKSAEEVLIRIENKLTGKDFNPSQKLSVHEQVKLLINQATSEENLSSMFIGWCPWL